MQEMPKAKNHTVMLDNRLQRGNGVGKNFLRLPCNQR